MVTLKSIRLRLSWSQAQAAEQLGVDRSFISRVERGQRRASADLIWKLSRKAGLTDRECIELLKANATQDAA